MKGRLTARPTNRRLNMNTTGNLISDITATFAALALLAYGVVFLANAANLL